MHHIKWDWKVVETQKEPLLVMIFLYSMAISTEVLREDRNHTTQSVLLFHCKGASKIKKKQKTKKNEGVKNKKEAVRSLYLLDITNTSKDVFFTSPWKKLKVVSHSLTSHC